MDRERHHRRGDLDRSVTPSVSRYGGVVGARIRRSPQLVHWAMLLGGFALLLWINRNQWFYYDDWDFVARTAGVSGSPGLFQPHNEHWSTLPILLWQGIFDIAGARTYIPYLAAMLLTHVALVHLVWRTIVRTGSSAWTATFATAVLICNGAGWENITWAFQIGFIASTASLFAGLLVVENDVLTRRRIGVTWLILVAGLMCSGIGVLAVAVVVLATLLRHRWQRAAWVASVPVATYAIWGFAVHLRSTLAPVPKSALLHLPDYIWTGLTQTADMVTGLGTVTSVRDSVTGATESGVVSIGVGAILLTVLAVWLVRTWETGRLSPLVYATALGAPALFLLTGSGRVGFGISQAASSRYIYIAAFLLLPAAAAATQALLRNVLSRQIAGVVVLLAMTIHGVAILDDAAAVSSAQKQISRSRVLAAAALVGQPGTVGTTPDPQFAPQLPLDEVAVLNNQGALPAQVVPASLSAALDEATQLQIRIATTQPTDAGAPPSVVDGAVFAGAPSGCLAVGAGTTILTFHGPGAVKLLSQQAVDAEVRVIDPANPGVVALPRTVALNPGLPTWITSTAPHEQTMTIATQQGPVRICGVATP